MISSPRKPRRGSWAAALKHVGYKKPVAGCQFSVLSLFLRRENGSGSAVQARKWRLRRGAGPFIDFIPLAPFQRQAATDLYLLFPHLIRYWTMKRGKLNCACVGSHDKLSAKTPSRFMAAALKHVGYKKPVAGCQFSVLSLFLRRENGSGSAVQARKWRLRRGAGPFIDFIPLAPFQRQAATDLYLLFPHLIRYWTMKRGKLNCACVGSHDKLSAKTPSRFMAAALKHVGYKKPVAGCQFSVLSLFLRRENGSGSAVQARKWRLRRGAGPFIDFIPLAPFQRQAATDLYLLFPHLIRYWTMKRGKLNCACVGSHDKLSA